MHIIIVIIAMKVPATVFTVVSVVLLKPAILGFLVYIGVIISGKPSNGPVHSPTHRPTLALWGISMVGAGPGTFFAL
jgi:hypothetical protein